MLSQTQVQLCFVIVSIQAAWGNLINPCQDDNSPLTNNCFFCICEQATNCDVYKECSGGGFPGGPWCGPLNIGMDFWIQYGNCTLDGDDPKDPLSMERCLTDLACSMKVMRSFANGKNLGDCDGDGRMTCDDYSMAHFLGHIGCRDPDERARYKK